MKSKIFSTKSRTISSCVALFVFCLFVAACGVVSAPTSVAPTVTQKPSGYQKVDTITIPGVSGNKWSFDVMYIDGSTLYLPDRNTKSVDIIDLKSGKFVRTLGAGFTGLDPSGKNKTNGPNHILQIKQGLFAVSNGDSSVRFLDGTTGKVVTSISTGGKFRADGMAFDVQDHLLAVVNPNDDIPFVSFIDTEKLQLLTDKKLAIPESAVPDGGIDAIIFDSASHEFLLSVTKTAKYSNGVIYGIDPISKATMHHFAIPVSCNPNGLILKPGTTTLAVACSGTNSAILNLSSGDNPQAAVVEKATDADSVEYGNGFFFFAGNNTTGNSLTIASEDGKVIQQIADAPKSHSVIVDSASGKVYVPQSGIGLVVYGNK